jgi:hypothetical protein
MPSNVSSAVVRDSFPSTFTGLTYTATQSGGGSGFTASGSRNINNTVTIPTGSKITYKAYRHDQRLGHRFNFGHDNCSPPSGVPDPNTANNSDTDADTL